MADENDTVAEATVPVVAGTGGGAVAPLGGGALLEGFFNLNVLRQLGLMIGLAMSSAIGVWTVLWFTGADYRPLYSSLQHIDANKVVEVLDGQNIKYKIDTSSGALLVDSKDLFTARLKLADAGMTGDRAAGFELLDQEQPLGTSQFMENTRYRRGLEGELARTIRSISSVRSARVHLAVPRASVFIRDARRTSASVLIDLFPGGSLKREQVRSIANLIASSVPELQLEDVTVVDQKGNLLSSFDESDELVSANKELQYARNIEKDLVERIYRILRPIVGDGRFRAEVSVDVDFTAVEQTNEMYNPDLPALRSEQSMKEQRYSGASVGGVPGALSNQPPGNAEALMQTEVTGVSNGESGGEKLVPAPSSRSQSTRNFELDRTLSYTRHQVGRIRFLSVAVAVDDIPVLDAETGDVSYKPWEDAELERLAILIRDSVGFNVARGDSVNVVNASFFDRDFDEEEVVPEVLWYENPALEGVVKSIAGVLGLALVLLIVVRPIFKNLSSAGQAIRELEAQHAMTAAEAGMSEEISLTGADSMLLPSPGESYEQQINAIKGLIAEDPGRVAQVVKRWVAAEE